MGRLLDLDRVVIFLLDDPAKSAVFTLRAAWVREGVPELPKDMQGLHLTRLPPSLAAHRPLVAADPTKHPELVTERAHFERLGTRSVVAVPIVVDGVLHGVVTGATVLTKRSFGDEDVSFLESAARHLSAVFKETELVSQLGKERDRLRALFDLAMAVHRATTSEDVIRAALDGLRNTLGFPIGSLDLVSEDARSLVRAGGFGVPKVAAAREVVSLEPRNGAAELEAHVLEGDAPIVVDDLETDTVAGTSRERLLALGARSIGFFPLRVAGRAVGLLLVGCDGVSRRVEAEDVVTLQSFAGFVAVSLEQRRTAEASERAMREAQALSEASRALLTRTAQRDVLLNQIIDALVHPFGFENCRLFVVDGEGGLEDVAHRGDWSGSLERKRLPLDGPGLTTYAAREGRVVNVPDVSQDPHYLMGWPPARSELVVPLVIDGEAVGVFDLQSRRLGAFSADDERVLTAFADRAALAVRLSHLVSELERRTRVFESITRATQLLNFRLHAPDVLSSVAEETSRAFPRADGSVVYVASPDGGTLTVAASFGIGRAVGGATGAPIPVDRLFCAGVAFRESRPVILAAESVDELISGESVTDRARVKALLDGRDFRHLLAAPIRVADQRLGVIEVLSSRPRAFNAADAETLALLAEQAAIALRNARLIEELQRSNRLKDDFLANLSHEVRTPLTGIVGWAEVLLDAKGADPESRRALGAILSQAETLSRMLADLIDLSRIDSFGLEIERVRVRLADTIASAVDAVAPSAKKRSVSIRCDLAPDLPGLEGDPARLKQVVWNLVANAVKFSSAGGVVTVSAGRSGDGLVLSVEDQGFGIEPSFLPYVFDRFRQEETSTNRRFGGLGVGLSIARAIVRAHGGTIEVASEGRGRGSRFSVRFPRERLGRPISGTAIDPARAAGRE